MSRPLVLLDVDGVLNAIPYLGLSEAWPDWQSGTAVAGGGTYRITWSPSVVATVLSWADVAEVQWLTTWGHDANVSLRHLLEMPGLPVAGTHDEDPFAAPVEGRSLADVTPAAPDALTGRWWKFDVVRRLVRAEPDRRVVWIDDDLAGQEDVRAWMSASADCLLVAPDPASGLTPEDLAEIDRWLRS